MNNNNNNNNNENYSTRANKEFGKITKAYNTTVSEHLRSIINSEIDYYKLDDPEKREQRLQRVNDITSNVYNIKINEIIQELKVMKNKIELNDKELKLLTEKVDTVNQTKKIMLDNYSNLHQQLEELKKESDKYKEYVQKERKNSLNKIVDKVIFNYFNKKEFNEVDVTSIIDYEFEYVHLPRIAIINYIQTVLRKNEDKILRIPDLKNNRETNIELTKENVNELCTILGKTK